MRQLLICLDLKNFDMAISNIDPVSDVLPLEYRDIQAPPCRIGFRVIRIISRIALDSPKMGVKSMAFSSRKSRKNVDHVRVDKKFELHELGTDQSPSLFFNSSRVSQFAGFLSSIFAANLRRVSASKGLIFGLR